MIDGQYDAIVGGPPCKPWSTVNLTRRGNKHPDYGLLSSFFKHVEHLLPDIFMMENVVPLQKDEMLYRYLRKLHDLKYSISVQTVCYSDYGAATSRRRLVIFGSRNCDSIPICGMLDAYRKKAMTVRDAIWKLRNKQKGEISDHEWPELKTITKYMPLYREGRYGWYILKWDKPAPSFGNVMKTYILHPDSFNGGESRVISVRESLLIMGFPQEFTFPEGLGIGTRYQMVADSVSPAFSCAAARVIKQLLGRKT